jgi:hypothetical protein
VLLWGPGVQKKPGYRGEAGLLFQVLNLPEGYRRRLRGVREQRQYLVAYNANFADFVPD